LNGKNARQLRKLEKHTKEHLKVSEQNVADRIVAQLFNSPFKYRFKFAMKLIVGKL